MNEPYGVGFVGLGQNGHPMASRLIDVRGGLTVFDLDPSNAATLVLRGARVASSVAHLAELCELVCIMVRNDVEVRAVVEELLTGTQPGTTILIHSTIRPDTVVELSQRAAAIGVHLLDAAATGGPSAAEQGTLAILVGGPVEPFEAVRPVLERMADLVLHLGDVGSGTRANLARTLLQYVAITAAGEAARLAEAAGINPAVLGHIVRHSDAVGGGPGTVLWRETTAPMEEDDPWRVVYSRVRARGEKELHLAVELASQLGVETPLADVALRGLGPALGFPDGGGTVPVQPGAPAEPQLVHGDEAS
jgi:3-hydroxyisobutyrate dehydrogenase-like beta-hydroxyacid dehydrogenase